jgi:predicted RNA binding protein YcfA (HicA-like mRNA interferase family)
MKRLDLIKKLEDMGCYLVRHGGNHDWYRNPNTNAADAVPRHREVNEHLARKIIKKLSND